MNFLTALLDSQGKKAVNAVQVSFTVAEKKGPITRFDPKSQTIVFSGGDIVRIRGGE